VNGTLHAEDGRFVLRFERRLAHPAEKVWKALTDRDELRHWFPVDIEADLRPGAPMRFVFRNGEGPALDGEVIEYDPPRVFAYLWGADLFRWELHPGADGCLLVFTQAMGEQGRAARDGAGWHVCLDHLVARLDGTGPPEPGAWPRVHAEYVRRFGPAAATIGPPG